MNHNIKSELSPLVVQPLPGIGDAMWYLPHMRALAAQSPTKKIILLTKETSKANELLMGEEIIEHYIWLQRDRRPQALQINQRHQGVWGSFKLANDLRMYHFETAWILHHSIFYANACRWAGIKNRIGHTPHKWCHGLTHPLLIDKKLPLTPREKSTNLLEGQGLWLDHYDYPLYIIPQAQQDAQQLLHRPNNLIKVILGIGASGAEKCWPIEKFIELTKWLLQQGCQVIVCGGPHEQPLAAQVMASCAHDNLLNCTNQTVQHTIAIIKLATLYIGNDTSLMNIAVNQRKKSWVFFGPTYTVYSDLITPMITASAQVRDITVDDVQQHVKEYLLNCYQNALV